MSSKLALKQLQSLQESRERPNGDREIRKVIKKKKRSNRKLQVRQQQQAVKQQQQGSKQLEYYKATTSVQKATSELMSKLLGQPVPQEDSESDFDLDF